MAHLADRFAAAVRTLVSDGPVKQRLCRAYAEHLEDLQDIELPPALRGDFPILNQEINGRPLVYLDNAASFFTLGKTHFFTGVKIVFPINEKIVKNNGWTR